MIQLLSQRLVLVQGGYKGKLNAMAHNTLVHRIAVLSKAHQLKQLKNPCYDPKVRELLSRTRKAYAKRCALPQKKDALTKDPLQALLAACDDSLRGKRDRALLLFAWASGGRRRSEVTSAQIQFLKRVWTTDFIYTLAYSKTNQSGVDQPENGKPVLGAAGMALHDWLQVRQITERAIFRRIRARVAIWAKRSPRPLCARSSKSVVPLRELKVISRPVPCVRAL
jgi:integrase